MSSINVNNVNIVAYSVWVEQSADGLHFTIIVVPCMWLADLALVVLNCLLFYRHNVNKVVWATVGRVARRSYNDDLQRCGPAAAQQQMLPSLYGTPRTIAVTASLITRGSVALTVLHRSAQKRSLERWRLRMLDVDGGLTAGPNWGLYSQRADQNLWRLWCDTWHWISSCLIAVNSLVA